MTQGVASGLRDRLRNLVLIGAWRPGTLQATTPHQDTIFFAFPQRSDIPLTSYNPLFFSFDTSS